MQSTVRPFAEAWDEFTLEINAMTQRCDRINEMAHQRAVRELRKLHPALPVQSCLYLAHNWLVCGDDRNKARKAKFIINRYHAVTSKTYQIKKAWYTRRYAEVLKPYRN